LLPILGAPGKDAVMKALVLEENSGLILAGMVEYIQAITDGL
jgi:hypothetical protein